MQQFILAHLDSVCELLKTRDCLCFMLATVQLATGSVGN